MTLDLSDRDRESLRLLEEELWREETRFDEKRMAVVMAEDFFEFGRSGRRYNRDEILSFPRVPMDSILPLPEFEIRLLSPDVVLVTYISAVRYEGKILRANRSSIWSRTAESWELRFHQGTPAVVNTPDTE